MSGIIDEQELPSLTLMLVPEDYPEIFRNPKKLYAHPNDYKLDDSPITPQLFLYKDGARSRLFLRISIKVTEANDSLYTTATFLLDTGGCAHMFLSPALFTLLKGRIHIEDAGLDFIKTKIDGEEVNCQIKKDLPVVHQPANVMGLPMLFLMGLKLHSGRTSRFTFNGDGTADDVASQRFEYI
jgi:hypothetical protein